MKMKFTLFLASSFLILFTTANSVSAQAVGDFQSNGTGGGDWTIAATWQTWNGSAWVAAGASPTSADGVITVLSGDSVALAATITIDQVVVAAGGKLAMGGGNTITLANTPPNAIDNSGKLYVINGTVTGTGSILNRLNAQLKVENSGILAAPTTNSGEVQFSNTSAVGGGAVLTNGNLINWIDGNLFTLDGASIVNNDSMAILPAAAVSLFTNNTGTLTNNGVIYLKDPALNLTVSNTFATSGGSIRGFGQVSFSNTSSNTGTVIPGDDNSAAILNVGGNFASTGSPTYRVNLVSSSATPTAGTSYSQVALANGVNLSSSTLTVLDNATGDAIGATYTVMTATAGSFTGSFATTNLPANIGSLTVSGGNVTVTRTGTLPLTWGSFNVRAAGAQAVLNWTTLQESNTDAFIIERSADGVSFSPIGTVRASGNTSKTTAYTFTDASPSQQGYNYYRLQQTDLDGKKSYSQIDVIGFGSKSAVFVQTSPNPVRDLLNITVQADNIMIGVTDLSGRTVKQLRLNRGFHQTGTSDLAPGVYQLTFYQGYNRIGGQQLIKL
jgi:hypothetical protein